MSETAGDGKAAERPGDLGRRLRSWQERRGLTRRELAERARIDPGYLEYLETAPTSHPSTSALRRIAEALGTTTVELLGGNVDRVPGRPPGARSTRLVELDPHECWVRLAAGGIGRIVLALAEGPIALPVNFVVEGGRILFRTGSGSVVDRLPDGTGVSFEVDHADDAMRLGWSVLAAATLEHLSADDVAALDKRAEPWAPGRDVWVWLKVERVTGRRIEAEDSDEHPAGSERAVDSDELLDSDEVAEGQVAGSEPVAKRHHQVQKAAKEVRR